MAMGLHPVGAARVLLVVAAGLGLALQGVGFVPGEVLIGDDGVFVRSLWKRTFIPRRALAAIDYTSGKKLRIVEKGGAAHELFLLRESGVGPMRGALAQLLESGAVTPAGDVSAAHEALASRALAWASAGTTDVARPETAYRRDEPEEHLWEIAEDVDAQPLARAGAVLALAPTDDGGRARAKRIAENAAHPLVAGAFDAAARGDREALRLAIAAGLRAPTAQSKVARPSAGAEEGGWPEAGVLHPPRVLHALAWSTNVWFVFPILAVALRSLPLGIVAGVMGVLGGMPWAAVRDYDPLRRFASGAVKAENGFLVQNGRRLFALADVKRAYLHHRPGQPAVVRFEGAREWVLLDVRVGGPRATRAFFERLPLTEEQRTVPFSTMQTSKGFERAMIMLLTLTIGALAIARNALPGYAIASILGAAFALIRIRRFVTPGRDRLTIRSLGTTRVVSYGAISTVERRKGAGTVVTNDGERIKLRAIEGDLTSAPDDDLTEAVIDRWSAWRAAKARIRVAAEGSEAKGEEREEEKEATEKEEEEEKEKREKEASAEEEAREEEEEREEGEGEEKKRKRI